MVQIIQDFIPVGNGNRSRIAMKPQYITVHNTSNTSKGAGAKSHANFAKNPKTAVSWHFTVDDSVIYQHLPLNEVGWHAGDGRGTGNMKSIGIEICENTDSDFEVAVKNAQWLINKLMKEHGISLSNVVPHKHWSGKLCPRKLLDRWDSFKAGISGSVTESKPAKTPSKSSSSAKPAPSKSKSKLPSGIFKVTTPLTKGASVKAIQEALASVYYYPDKGAKNNGVDGYYGPKTANAVKRFQSMYGLTADGIYGPATKAKLEKVMK
ncbi:N-acetylmuramoyl-L-alanine amidase [Listeria phage LIS04]|nr:N-acetylmuramoyl-L-alanine amidase [Listeria phage LIS04]